MIYTITFQLRKHNVLYQDNAADIGQSRSDQGSKNPYQVDRQLVRMSPNTGSKRLHKAVLLTHKMVNHK